MPYLRPLYSGTLCSVQAGLTQRVSLTNLTHIFFFRSAISPTFDDRGMPSTSRRSPLYFDENGKTCPRSVSKRKSPGLRHGKTLARDISTIRSIRLYSQCRYRPLEAPLSVTESQSLKNRQKSIPRWQIPMALAGAIIIAQEQLLYYFWIPKLYVVHEDAAFE